MKLLFVGVVLNAILGKKMVNVGFILSNADAIGIGNKFPWVIEHKGLTGAK